MTKAEKRLWYEVLCKNQLLGLRFLRQRIIDNYIADFYCASLRLVIEVDGKSHLEKQEYDQERDQVFERMRISVLRLSNACVINDFERAREIIFSWCILSPLYQRGKSKAKGD